MNTLRICIPKLLDCGMNTLQGSHITTRELEEMGAKFCEGLLKVRSRHIKMMKGGGTSSTTSGVDSNTDLSGSATGCVAFICTSFLGWISVHPFII